MSLETEFLSGRCPTPEDIAPNPLYPSNWRVTRIEWLLPWWLRGPAALAGLFARHVLRWKKRFRRHSDGGVTGCNLFLRRVAWGYFEVVFRVPGFRSACTLYEDLHVWEMLRATENGIIGKVEWRERQIARFELRRI